MPRTRLWLLTVPVLFLAGCDDVPNTTSPINPEAGRVRLEVTGTSCSGVVRWDVAGTDNGVLGDPQDFPWSMSLEAESGDEVALQACNDCEQPGTVTITTSVYWEGTLLESSTRTGSSTLLCAPTSEVQVRIP